MVAMVLILDMSVCTPRMEPAMFKEGVTLMVNQEVINLGQSLCRMTGISWRSEHLLIMASMVLNLDMSVCTPGMEPAMFNEGMTLMVNQAVINLDRQSLSLG